MFQLEILRLAQLANPSQRERIGPARQDGYRCDATCCLQTVRANNALQPTFAAAARCQTRLSLVPWAVYAISSVFRAALIAIVASLLASSVASATTSPSGLICIAPLPVNASESDHDYPEGKAPREYTYNFNVRIDDRESVSVPSNKPLLIKGLELGKKHRVRISDGNRTIESFLFSFEARSSRSLCLSYTPWYQTWSLERPARRPWCKCK
jgi:hypothetical protein